MRISTRGRYALRMMLDIARHGDDGDPISLSTVSERTGISHGYLEQLAPALRAARLVKSVAGRHGGYRLAALPSEISIGQIIEASIGPINIVDCVEEPDACLRSDTCECRVVYTLINDGIARVLEEYSLADLMDPRWSKSPGRDFTGQLLTPGGCPSKP